MDILDGEIGTQITATSIGERKAFALSSYGGDLYAGFALHDIVKSAGDVEIYGIGMVASAATILMLGTDKRYGTPNSRYLIHNPHAITVGDADAFQSDADELRIEQGKVIDLYAENLTIPKDEIVSIMKAEKTLTAEDALRIGLIKEIRNLPKNQTNMDNTEIKNELGTLHKALAEIKAMFSPKPKIKNLLVQDVNGVELDMPGIEDMNQLDVGVEATANGEPANGSYQIADGRTLVFEGGTLTEIMPAEAEAEAEDTSEIEMLRAENAELKAQIQNFAGANEKIKSLENKLVKLQSAFSNEVPEMKTPAETQKPAKGYVIPKGNWNVNKIK